MSELTMTDRSSLETAASRKWQNRLLAWCAARFGRFALPLTLLGGVIVLVGSLLAWTYSVSYANNLSVSFSPIGGQRWAIGGALALIAFALIDPFFQRRLSGIFPNGGTKATRLVGPALLVKGGVVAVRAVKVLGGLSDVHRVLCR